MARHPGAMVRSARWAAASHASVRRQLSMGGLRADVDPPTAAPEDPGAVNLILRLRRATCLERSLVVQSWLASQGIHRDVVIGAKAVDGVAAHAWIDGEDGGRGYVELTRVSLPQR